MPKEQYATNSQDETLTNIPEDLLASSEPARTGPYRSLSAKRPRDPSHRKSVKFNDVPIVHEVPSYDTMRSSNCDTYRSWAYTDATPSTSVIPSFYPSQILSPFNSTSAAAQKIHANRMSSALYSTSSTITTPNRIPDWAVRAKTLKTASTTEETDTTNENNTAWNPPMIIVHTPDERTNKDTAAKINNYSSYNNPYVAYSQPTQAPATSLSINPENGEEKKHPYRSAMTSDTEHYRSLPFTYGPLSDSTATYTSMLSTNLIPSNHSSNDQSITGHTRTARARSATLPITVTHSSTRANDTVSITPFRATTAALSSNGSTTSSRTVLRPTTIAFQCSQPATTAAATINGSPTVATTNYTNTINSTLTAANANSAKPPTVPPRFNSSAAAAAAAHSRFVSSSNRTLSTSSLASSAIKCTFAHPANDSTLTNGLTSQTTSTPKALSTAYPRSRSANVLNTRRNTASPVGIIDGQSGGGTATSATNPTTSLYATAKRNPNVRQTYGSYYMHRVLLPTTIK